MSAPVRTKHVLATGLAVVLTGGGLAAVAAPAHATTGSVKYTCTDPLDPTKTFELPVEIDSDAPAKVYVGDTANIKVSSKSALPGALAKTFYDAPTGARFFDGSIAGNGTVKTGNGQPTSVVVNQAIPETAIPDQATATDVPFTATSASAIPFKPTALGDLEMSAGDFVATIKLKDAAKAPTVPPQVDVTCKAPNGKAPVIDTVVVAAKSTTTLAVSPSSAGYGAAVTATATVTTTAGAPDGDVTFVVGGVSTKVPVKDGKAVLELDQSVVGSHSVSATFTPKDATHYDGSSAAPVGFKVSKAATSTRVKIIGKRVRERTAATVKVVGINKTVPTGTVKLVLRKAGNQGFHKAKSGALAKGSRGFNLGRLGKGRYKVVVKYLGDGNHNKSKTVKRFRVRR